MKRKLLTLLLTVVISITGVWCGDMSVEAQDGSEDIDISELMTEDAIIGYSIPLTKGVYYSDGSSIINKIASNKVGAGGVTNAAIKCTVKVTSILERKNSSGSWEYVSSWTQTNQNAYTAMISKSVIVGTGYYYRVRSYHYAGTDSSSSSTNALWMGN